MHVHVSAHTSSDIAPGSEAPKDGNKSQKTLCKP